MRALRESWLTATLYFKGHFLCFSKQINIFQSCLKFTSKQFSQSRFFNYVWNTFKQHQSKTTTTTTTTATTKLGTSIWCNWEYAREEILINNYVSIFDSHDFFILINCSKNFLKSSIASFISYAKESPEAYLEPCQISMKKIFCENS